MSNDYPSFLANLFEEMKDKSKNSKSSESYTAHLTRLGSEPVGKKLMEEAFELAISGIDGDKNNDKSNIVPEAADVIYHLLALLVSHGIDFKEVVEELESRNKK